MASQQKLDRELKLAELIPFAVIITDTEYIVTYWNKGAQDILGWKYEEAEGQLLNKLLGIKKTEFNHIVEARHIGKFNRKDGSEVRCEFKSIIIEDRLIFIFRDITKEYEKEKELKSYQDFFEKAQDMFFRMGKMEFNPRFAHKLGYSKNELVGIPLSPLVHPDDLNRFKDEFLRVLKGETRSYEVRMMSKNGDVIWFEVISWPWKSEGVTIGSEGILRDVTGRKIEEINTKKLVERLKILNSVLRHDLSNYLGVIGNYLELLEEEPSPEYIKKVQNIVKRSLELIKDIKIVEEAEKTGRIMKVINLSEVLKEEIRRLEGPNIKIEAKIDDDLYLWADEMAKLVFNNLIGNAIIHNDKEDKEIYIRAKKVLEKADWDDEVEEIRWIEVKIGDNGPGIPDDMKKEIFKEGVKSQETGRTGLGLFLVKILIERYAGKIWVEDNYPEGSIFVVRLRSSDNIYNL